MGDTFRVSQISVRGEGRGDTQGILQNMGVRAGTPGSGWCIRDVCPGCPCGSGRRRPRGIVDWQAECRESHCGILARWESLVCANRHSKLGFVLFAWRRAMSLLCKVTWTCGSEVAGAAVMWT
jgi:hypothetical protein